MHFSPEDFIFTVGGVKVRVCALGVVMLLVVFAACYCGGAIAIACCHR